MICCASALHKKKRPSGPAPRSERRDRAARTHFDTAPPKHARQRGLDRRPLAGSDGDVNGRRRRSKAPRSASDLIPPPARLGADAERAALVSAGRARFVLIQSMPAPLPTAHNRPKAPAAGHRGRFGLGGAGPGVAMPPDGRWVSKCWPPLPPRLLIRFGAGGAHASVPSVSRSDTSQPTKPQNSATPHGPPPNFSFIRSFTALHVVFVLRLRLAPL